MNNLAHDGDEQYQQRWYNDDVLVIMSRQLGMACSYLSDAFIRTSNIFSGVDSDLHGGLGGYRPSAIHAVHSRGRRITKYKYLPLNWLDIHPDPWVVWSKVVSILGDIPSWHRLRFHETMRDKMRQGRFLTTRRS